MLYIREMNLPHGT